MPNGAGSIIQRTDGRWMARFTARDHGTGLPVRKALYAPTEQEARVRLMKALTDLHEGRLVLTRGRQLTLKQWAERWLVSRHKRPSTMKTDREVLEQYVLPMLGTVRLGDLRPVHLRGVMDAQIAAGKSPRTANKIREVTRKVLNAVNREHPGYLPFNAAELVEPIPQLGLKKRVVLEPEQVHQLLECRGVAPGRGLLGLRPSDGSPARGGSRPLLGGCQPKRRPGLHPPGAAVPRGPVAHATAEDTEVEATHSAS
jgi:hypothetical protein